MYETIAASVVPAFDCTPFKYADRQCPEVVARGNTRMNASNAFTGDVPRKAMPDWNMINL